MSSCKVCLCISLFLARILPRLLVVIPSCSFVLLVTVENNDAERFASAASVAVLLASRDLGDKARRAPNASPNIPTGLVQVAGDLDSSLAMPAFLRAAVP